MLTDQMLQTERVGALGEREGERDPVGRHPRGDPLHCLSQKPAGEAERGGGEEVDGGGGRATAETGESENDRNITIATTRLHKRLASVFQAFSVIFQQYSNMSSHLKCYNMCIVQLVCHKYKCNTLIYNQY